jgi:hypothetical protein
MRKSESYVGERFGRRVVTAVRREPRGVGRATIADVTCDCGSKKSVNLRDLLYGGVVSCGCYHSERSSLRFKKHGRSTSVEYFTWRRMKQRCLQKNLRSWPDYGGRGITVCAQWVDSFENFLADMGPRPGLGYSLDRIDNDGNYEPGNCRWALLVEQANNKRSSRLVEAHGKRQTVAQWARETGIREFTIRYRLNQGWSPDDAVTVPVKRVSNA